MAPLDLPPIPAGASFNPFGALSSAQIQPLASQGAAPTTYSGSGFSQPLDITGTSFNISYPLLPQGGKMSDGPTRDEFDAKLGRVAAETDTKIVRLEGKLDTMAATLSVKLDSLSNEIGRSRDETRDSRLIVIATVIGSALTVAVLVVALWTYGDALFGRGMNVHDVVQSVVREEQLQKAPVTAPPPAANPTQPKTH